MAKAKKRKATKPAGAVAMKAAVSPACSHAGCDHRYDPRTKALVSSTCTAGRQRLTQEDLPGRGYHAIDDVEQAIAALGAVTVEALAVVERRAGRVVGRPEEGAGLMLRDGYPTSLRSGSPGRAERLCTAEVLVAGHLVRCGARRPCENHPADDDDLLEIPPPDYADPSGELGATLADVPDWIQQDGVPKAVQRFYRHLKKATDQVTLATAMLDELLRSPLAGRGSSVGVCRACDRTVAGVEGDRLRNGYCQGCDRAWRRRCETTDGPVDVAAFESERRRRRRDAA